MIGDQFLHKRSLILGMIMRTAVIVALSSAGLSACATRPATPEEAGSARFVIEQDLQGASRARGEFRSITGVRRGFTAQLNGRLDGRVFTLIEDFTYDDGERDRKTWRLEQVSPGQYVGEREDVVGKAKGYQEGNVFRLEYDVILPSKNGRGRKVRFKDVMALTDDGSILNKATVGLWGLRVGSVRLLIRRTVDQGKAQGRLDGAFPPASGAGSRRETDPVESRNSPLGNSFSNAPIAGVRTDW